VVLDGTVAEMAGRQRAVVAALGARRHDVWSEEWRKLRRGWKRGRAARVGYYLLERSGEVRHQEVGHQQ
jgi:hypothetical protein